MLEARVKQAVVLKKLLDGKPISSLQLKTKAHSLRRYCKVYRRHCKIFASMALGHYGKRDADNIL